MSATTYRSIYPSYSRKEPTNLRNSVHTYFQRLHEYADSNTVEYAEARLARGGCGLSGQGECGIGLRPFVCALGFSLVDMLSAA
jgi:hypothetical protein